MQPEHLIQSKREHRRESVVLLHGFMGATTDWEAVAGYLGCYYQCLAPTLPGHIGAPVLMDSIATDDALEDLFSQVSERLPGPFHLLGYSLGGRIALRLAQKFPERIRSLVLESAHPGLSEASGRAEREASDRRWAYRFKRESLPVVLADWFSQPVYANLAAFERDSQIDSILRTADEVGVENAGLRLAKVLLGFSLSQQVDFSGFLAAAEFPTLYISGEYDRKYCSIGRQLAASCGNLRHQVFGACGHNVHQSAPKRYARQVGHFLRQSSRVMSSEGGGGG